MGEFEGAGENVQRFSPAQFKVLKSIEQNAAQDDFLSEQRLGEICKENGIATEDASGRESLLDIFDKLGIVMHFERLPFLADYVLNPRWLTYGVYTIMYSQEAKTAQGRLSEAGLVSILKQANPSISGGRALSYPADRCGIIAGAMVAFRVAYRLGSGELVIPALIAPEQPDHDFKPYGTIAFRFDFGGFLPRHVLPALAVEYFQDIAKLNGREIIWQNGVLLRPRRHDAERSSAPIITPVRSISWSREQTRRSISACCGTAFSPPSKACRNSPLRKSSSCARICA